MQSILESRSRIVLVGAHFEISIAFIDVLRDSVSGEEIQREIKLRMSIALVGG
jgi:hypothetical protein